MRGASGCGGAALVVEHLSGMSEVLGSIPSTDNNNNSGSCCCLQTEALVTHSWLEVSM